MNKQKIFNAQALSEETGLHAPTVSKVLGMLAKANLVDSRRGAHGGFLFPEHKDDVTIAEIVEAIDGPVALTQCVVEGENGKCELSDSCVTRPHWAAINNAVWSALNGVSISQMINQPEKAELKE